MRSLILLAAVFLTFPAMAGGQDSGEQGSVLYKDRLIEPSHSQYLGRHLWRRRHSG